MGRFSSGHVGASFRRECLHVRLLLFQAQVRAPLQPGAGKQPRGGKGLGRECRLAGRLSLQQSTSMGPSQHWRCCRLFGLWCHLACSQRAHRSSTLLAGKASKHHQAPPIVYFLLHPVLDFVSGKAEVCTLTKTLLVAVNTQKSLAS